ncbi:MAG: hypothetical protein ACI4QX_00235 [Lachnospiraceae bacterium]
MKKLLKKAMLLLTVFAVVTVGSGTYASAAVPEPVSPQYDNRVSLSVRLTIYEDTAYCSATVSSPEEITSVRVEMTYEKNTYAGEFYMRVNFIPGTATELPYTKSETIFADPGYVYTLYVTATVDFADGTSTSITESRTVNY